MTVRSCKISISHTLFQYSVFVMSCFLDLYGRHPPPRNQISLSTVRELRGTQVKSSLLTVLLLRTRRTFDTTSEQRDLSLSVWPFSAKQILQIEHE